MQKVIQYLILFNCCPWILRQYIQLYDNKPLSSIVFLSLEMKYCHVNIFSPALETSVCVVTSLNNSLTSWLTAHALAC